MESACGEVSETSERSSRFHQMHDSPSLPSASRSSSLANKYMSVLAAPPGPVTRSRSWSRAGVMGDQRYRQLQSCFSPAGRLLPKSKLEYLLNLSSVPLYDRVQQALAAEAHEQTLNDSSEDKSFLRPSFYFRCQSRKDLQRPPSQVPDFGNYEPNFTYVRRRNPVCLIRKGTGRRTMQGGDWTGAGIGGGKDVRVRRKLVRRT